MNAVPSPQSHSSVRRRSPASLVAHIVEEHHSSARAALERLPALAREVDRRHGNAHPELAQVIAIVDAITASLVPHMRAEEKILFPAMLRMADPSCDAQTRRMLRLYIGVARHDHDDLDELSKLLREVTKDFAAHDDASPWIRTLYQELAAFDANLRDHLALEQELVRLTA